MAANRNISDSLSAELLMSSSDDEARSNANIPPKAAGPINVNPTVQLMREMQKTMSGALAKMMGCIEVLTQRVTKVELESDQQPTRDRTAPTSAPMPKSTASAHRSTSRKLMFPDTNNSALQQTTKASNVARAKNASEAARKHPLADSTTKKVSKTKEASIKVTTSHS